MMEQRKAERVNILGIDMNPVRVERAIGLTSHYLEKNKFEYIAFVNTAAALSGHEQEDFVEFMNQAALVLPGDSNIEEAVGIRHWIEEESTYQLEFFQKFLTKMNRQRASVYLMIEKEEELEKLKSILAKRYEKLQMEYILWQDEESIDSMVNDINILAPDILLICADYSRICGFMKEHGCKINAGLCFCMEAVGTNESMPLPEWVERFHLQKPYLWFYKKPLHFWHDILFKSTMKKTNSEIADSTEKTVQDDENL